MFNLLEYLTDRTESEIRSYLLNPTQTVLIEAPKGYGANELSRQVAKNLDKAFLSIRPKNSESGSLIINVSMIRQIYSLSSGKKQSYRIIIIESADKMTISAQNAFLKLLEEPGMNTLFILSTEEPNKILGTVQSRSRIIKVDKISKEGTEKIINNNLKSLDRKKQVLFLGAGLPMELVKLCKDDDYFARRSVVIRDSMTIVSGTIYDRLKVVDKHKENRQAALKLIDDSLLIISNTLFMQQSAELVHLLSKLLLARDSLYKNGNVRLNLMRIVL